MAQEIERKYLIREDGIDYVTEVFSELYSSVQSVKEDVLAHGETIQQGYMPIERAKELADKLGIDVDFSPEEARLRDKDGKLSFTLKGKASISRNELEFEISPELFREYWPCTQGKRLEKVRLEKAYEGHTLEIDVYTDNRDLIVAEVEVATIEAAERLKRFGFDVTNKKQYRNENLGK